LTPLESPRLNKRNLGGDSGGMTAAELSSLATALDELTQRITAMADDPASQQRDDVASELFEVERALAGASRRLMKVADSSERSTRR